MPREREPPPTTIAELIDRLESHLRRLAYSTVAATSASSSSTVSAEAPGPRALRESLEALLTTLRHLDSEVSLFTYLEDERRRRPRQGVPWHEISHIPGISELARACFRRPDGSAVAAGLPLRVEWCIEPRIAPFIYLRYLAEYGALPHNREIPLYFAVQLYGEFVLGREVDYGSRRPGGGFGVGRMAQQTRERGEQARRLPPALRHGQPYLVPFPVVQTVGLQLSQEATTLVQQMVESFAEVRIFKVYSTLHNHWLFIFHKFV